jgi:TolB-like protein/DNA-binding SARP family transcriptional activator/Flp pilus assembly protein TadD
LAPITSKKAQGLLAYLALAPGGSATRDKLIGVLWSDRDGEHARNSLRQVLTGLRRDLAPIGFDILIADRDRLMLTNRVRVDVKEFEELAGSTKVDDLERAVGHYRGSLLDGVFALDDEFEQWARQQRSRLFERVVTAYERLLATTSPEKRVGFARTLLGLDPSRESSHRALMRALCDAGERDQALRQYEICRDMLAREFDTRPSAETERLKSAIASGTGLSSPAAPTAQKSPPADAEAPGRRAAPEGIPSLAVLPFANLSGDREQDYFADGLTNDIINALCRFRNLHVIARSSSFRYRGRDVDVRQVGRDLGVQYVLEGSVRRSEHRIRVTAQLIEAETGAQIWASRYDRDLEDLLLVQDETARAIVSTFGKVVETAEWDRASRLSPDGLRAHELLLRASNLWARPRREQMAVAREQLRQAAALDPTKAEVHVKLANLHYLEWELWWVEDRTATLRLAYDYATKAVHLDERSSHCKWALAMIQMARDEFEQARLNFEKAIELNPNDARARVIYGWYLTAVGQPERAIEQVEQARRYDPLEEGWMPWIRGIAYYTAQRYQEAVAAFSEINDPYNEVTGWLALSLAQAGRIEEAQAVLRKFLEVARTDMVNCPGDRVQDWIEFWRGATQYRNESDFDRVREGLRKAGMPD